MEQATFWLLRFRLKYCSFCQLPSWPPTQHARTQTLRGDIMSWLRRSGVRLVQAWNRTGSTSGGEAARIWRTVPSRSLPATACAHNTTLFCEQPVPVSAFFTAARSVPRDGGFSHRKYRTVHARSLSSPSSSDPLDVFDIVDLNTKRCMSNDLCENENCWRCLSRSFAIHDRAKSWSKQNTLRPRQVKLKSSETFLFTCDVCGGDCSMRPRSIRADTVVMCKKCRAGPQIFLEDVWSTRNSKRMSDVEQREKCWLFCSDCQHHFVGRKSKTYRPLRPGETKLAKQAWSCPYCKPNDSRISCTDSSCKFCREHDTRRIQPPEAFAEIYAAFNVRPLSDRMLYLRTQTTSRNEKYWLGFQKCPHLLEEGSTSPVMLRLRSAMPSTNRGRIAARWVLPQPARSDSGSLVNKVRSICLDCENRCATPFPERFLQERGLACLLSRCARMRCAVRC